MVKLEIEQKAQKADRLDVPIGMIRFQTWFILQSSFISANDQQSGQGIQI